MASKDQIADEQDSFPGFRRSWAWVWGNGKWHLRWVCLLFWPAKLIQA